MKYIIKMTEYKANGTGECRELESTDLLNLNVYYATALAGFRGNYGELTAEDAEGNIVARHVVSFSDGVAKWTIENINPEQWWKFGGDNIQARYGYGTHAEAVRYCEILNRGREINQYFIMEADRPDSDLCDEWNNISDDLAAIHEEQAAQ